METAATDLITWQNKYSVGIPEIDAQHKKLIAAINELFRAMRAGHGNEVMGKVFENLVTYTEQHFAYEEAMMRKAGYPGTAGHVEVHRQLARQVLELRDSFRAGKLMMSMKVLNFLKDWLSNHILGADAQYARHMRNNSPIGLRQVQNF